MEASWIVVRPKEVSAKLSGNSELKLTVTGVLGPLP